MNSRIFAITMLMFASFAAVARGERHIFTDDKGRTLEGELVSVAGDMVTIKRTADGRLLALKATQFSQADQVYFAIKGRAASATPGVPATDKPAAASGGLSSTAPAPPMRIDVKVSPVKKQISQNDIIDDTIQRVSFRADIRNEERQRALTGAKATLVAFAQDLNDPSESMVILREDFDVTIEPLTSQSLVTQEIKLKFDERGYKYGHKYTGSFVLVLKGSDGKVINVTPSNTPAAKSLDAVLKLKFKDVVDRNFKFLKEGYLRQ